MALSDEELKAAILEKAAKAPKPALYIKDFYACDPDAKPRAVKNIANDLVKAGKLEFFSSGSTTMYVLKGRMEKADSTK